MTKINLTKKDIVLSLNKKNGYSIAFTKMLVNDLISSMIETLKDDNLFLKNIGSFKKKEKKERIGRNPKTGIEAPITARKVVTFKPSQIMKEKINKGNQNN